MKIYIILIISFLLVSCNAVTNKVENMFIEMNNKLLDSISMFTAINDSLYVQLDANKYMKSDIQNYEKIKVEFDKFHSHLDSIQNLMLQNAKSTGDIDIVNKVMVEQGGEQKLRYETFNLSKNIAKHVNYLQFEDHFYKSIIEHEYLKREGFNQQPLFSAIPLINKWKSDKIQEQYRILSNVNEIPHKKNPQNLKVGMLVKHAKYGEGIIVEIDKKYVGNFKFSDRERRIILKFTKFEILEK